MLVKDKNDSPEYIRILKSKIDEINPDKVQLNTVVRPPAEEFAQPLTSKELKSIVNTSKINWEIIAEFRGKSDIRYPDDLKIKILALVRRRPATLTDISTSLGVHKDELIKQLVAMEKENKIKKSKHQELVFYEIK
jgi:wyosine [tRNA(Phe)-imidazoG37] synthetase (radical SAM superfamily)